MLCLITAFLAFAPRLCNVGALFVPPCPCPLSSCVFAFVRSCGYRCPPMSAAAVAPVATPSPPRSPPSALRRPSLPSLPSPAAPCAPSRSRAESLRSFALRALGALRSRRALRSGCGRSAHRSSRRRVGSARLGGG